MLGDAEKIEKQSFGASKMRPGSSQMEPRLAQNAKKNVNARRRRALDAQRCPKSPQERKIAPTWLLRRRSFWPIPFPLGPKAFLLIWRAACGRQASQVPLTSPLVPPAWPKSSTLPFFKNLSIKLFSALRVHSQVKVKISVMSTLKLS